MKLLTSIFVLGAAAAAVAQAPFTIVKPADGAKVREVVDVVMPRNSVPTGAFVGVQIDGRFVEAVVPALDEKAGGQVYKMDTKKLGIADGEHTLRLSLYGNVGGKPTIVENSEVKVVVANRADITIPSEGIVLAYKWREGVHSVYDLTVSMDESQLSEARNRMGGRASERALFEERLRILYACDDVKPGGDGLVRSQLLPYRGDGRDYLYITMPGDSAPSVQMKEKFSPVYRILKPNGTEVYGDVPNYWGFFGTDGGKIEEHVIAFIPLPILPPDPQRIGDKWTGSIALPANSIANVKESGKSYNTIPASGVFEAVEWEMGRPCAKIRYELSFGERSGDAKQLTIAGREFTNNARQRWMQTFWLDLNGGRIVKSDLRLEIDVRIDAPTNQGMGAGGGGNN
jgi:hypothetical protein